MHKNASIQSAMQSNEGMTTMAAIETIYRSTESRGRAKVPLMSMLNWVDGRLERRRSRRASVTSWPPLLPHPERYIIHRKFGFTQLIRE